MKGERGWLGCRWWGRGGGGRTGEVGTNTTRVNRRIGVGGRGGGARRDALQGGGGRSEVTGGGVAGWGMRGGSTQQLGGHGT